MEIFESFNAKAVAIDKAFRKHRIEKTGQVLVTFTITPGGAITEARILSSDFGSPELESELLDIVRGLAFEARAVPPFTQAAFPIGYRFE